MLLPVRRWASNQTHLADVPEEVAIIPVTIMGSPCEVIWEPITTVCGALLRADASGRAGNSIVVMVNWGEAKHARSQCRRCKRLQPDVYFTPA